MLNSFFSEAVANISQNNLTLAISLFIALLIIILILATLFPYWRSVLVRTKFLEQDEKPSSLLVWVISIVIIVKLVQVFVIQPFIVDGGSMLPTFHNKEFLLVDKLSYRIGTPHRGDVAIFILYEGTSNQYTGKHLIKRVIGLPGERVVIKNGVTTIYNTDHPEGFVLDESYVVYKDLIKTVDVTLDDTHFFMMGDNRAQSYDSREWGPLHGDNLKGQVLLRVYPFKAAGYEPGRYMYTN
jgi:signal peptidase I